MRLDTGSVETEPRVRPADALLSAGGLLLAALWAVLSVVAVGNETDLFGNGGVINGIAAGVGLAGALVTAVVGAACLRSSSARGMWRRRLGLAALAFSAWLAVTLLAVRL